MSTFPATLPERIHLTGGKGPGGEASAIISASDVLQMLRRRIVLVVSLSLFLCIVFGAGFVIWWTYFPGYRSECLIECVSNIPAAGLTVEQERLRQEEHERFVATQALLLKSPTILIEALKISAVRETDWFKSVQRRKKEPLIQLTDELAASPVRGTNFLRVALEARKKSDPAVIVDGVVRFWLETVKKRATDEFAADLQVAQTELEAFDRKIEDKRRQLGTIADRIPPGARLSPTANITSEEGRQLAAQVANLQLERAQLEQFKTMYNDPQGIAATAEDRVAVEQDPQVAELRRAVFLLEQQRAADQARYGPNHSVVRQLESQLNSARDKLTELESQRLSEIQSANREAANTAHANTQHQLYLAEESMARTEAALADQDRLLFEYSNLEIEIAQDMRYRVELSNYVKSLERVVRQRSAINVSIAQPATEPLERNSPSLWLIPVAMFLAIALSTGTALGLELLDKSIRTSQDVTRFLDLPMLGAVPHTDDEEVTIDQVETASRDSTGSLVAEAFRRIRTAMQFSAPAARQRTILVTSAQPEDGKTTVVCNLALAAALAGRRVLLVDANFRKAAVHRIFNVARTEGLSHLLVGQGTLESCVVRSNVAGLDILPAGPVPPNPAELLGSEPCRAFLATAANQYDQVIIDSAPVLVASDAVVLATAVDGVVMVVRAKHNTRGVSRRASQLIHDVGAHHFGVVLNAAQVARGGYFREQLRTFYEYQDSRDAK